MLVVFDFVLWQKNTLTLLFIKGEKKKKDQLVAAVFARFVRTLLWYIRGMFTFFAIICNSLFCQSKLDQYLKIIEMYSLKKCGLNVFNHVCLWILLFEIQCSFVSLSRVNLTLKRKMFSWLSVSSTWTVPYIMLPLPILQSLLHYIFQSCGDVS